jgi:acetyl esterase/lipase
MLVYEPPESVAPRNEIVFFIHGGGWKVGAPERRRPVVKLFTDLGYAVMMPAYRLTPLAAFPEMHSDIFRAFQEALHHPFAENRQFTLIGESAGANLGALLAYDREAQQRYSIDNKLIKGLISIVGVLDMEPLPDTFVVRDYSGPRGGAMFKRANPMYLIDETVSIPVLAVHGDNDGLVPHASPANFVDYINQLRPGLGEMDLVAGGTHVSVATDWYLEDNIQRKNILNWMEKSVSSK